jgi:hypothetical protein
MGSGAQLPVQRSCSVSTAESFNQTGFSRFINSQSGRAFRVVVGIGFILLGYLYRHQPLGVISMLWGLFPLAAGVFDVCFVSGVLGGPWSGTRIRETQHHHPSNQATPLPNAPR